MKVVGPGQLRELSLVSALLLALAVAVTLPAVFHLDTAGVGDPAHPMFGGDLFVSHVLDRSFREGNLLRWYETREVNFPVGETLSPSIVHSLNPYLSFPFYRLFPPIAAHNVVSLLVLAGNGLAMYLAARGLFRSRLAALVAAIVFAFNPYTVLKIGMGSVHKTLIAFLPIFVWALHRLGERPGRGRVLAAAGALTLVYQQYPLYGLYALVVVPPFAIWKALSQRSLRAVWACAAMLGCFGVMTLGIDLLLGLSGTPQHLSFSAHPALLPQSNGYFDLFHPFHQVLPAPTDRPIGLPVVAVAAACAVAARVRGLPRFLLFVAVLFTVLAAGPFLVHGGQPVVIAGRWVPLPYRLLDLAVPATYGRTLTFPLRCLSVVVTAFGFLAGAFVVWLAERLRPRPYRAAVAAFLVLFLGECFLRFPELFPVPSLPAAVPSFYRQIALQPGGALLHVPLPRTEEREKAHHLCLLSAVADRPLVNPHEAGQPAVATTPGPQTPIPHREAFVAVMAAQGVEWIVLHRDWLDGSGPMMSPADYRWLDDCCGPPAFDAEGIVAYRVPGAGR